MVDCRFNVGWRKHIVSRSIPPLFNIFKYNSNVSCFHIKPEVALRDVYKPRIKLRPGVFRTTAGSFNPFFV